MDTTDRPVKCHRCGRVLRAEASKRRLYGRGCWAIIRLAAITEAVKGFAAEQVTKARELIEMGAIVAIGRPGVFRAVSSNGTDQYLVHSAVCNCPAGLRGRSACYHVAAARILTATSRKAA